MLKLETVLTIQDPPSNYIIDRFLHAGQAILYIGQEGVGKSFLMHWIAMCMATGQDFLGRKVRPGKVLLFDEENSKADISQYMRWVWRGMGCPDVAHLGQNLFVEHMILGLKGPARWIHMTTLVSDIKPDLIIIDTANPVCGIKDENSNAEAADATQKLRGLLTVAGDQAGMFILKHLKQTDDGPMDVRGAKGWKGAADGVLYHGLGRGRPRQDGMRHTYIVSGKTRAFGLPLHERIELTAERTENRGIRLVKT